MLKNSLILLLASTSAIADVNVLPPINSFPLFYTIVGQDPMYQPAANKAQEAFLLQVGLTQRYNALNAYVNRRATNEVVSFIDKDTPLDSHKVFFIVGTAYAAGVKRQIIRSFRNPWFPRVTHTVSISQNVQSISVQIPF